MQAGLESGLSVSASLLSGIHFMHQACGILGAYSAISFEKFVIDEEACGMMKYAVRPIEIADESIGLDLIERVGIGGNYLMQPETAQRCRTEFFPSKLTKRGTYEDWSANNFGDITQIAVKHVRNRLDAYVKPDIDPGIEKDLKKYVKAKSNE